MNEEITYRQWRKMSWKDVINYMLKKDISDRLIWDYITSLRGPDGYRGNEDYGNGYLKILFNGFLRGNTLEGIDIVSFENHIIRCEYFNDLINEITKMDISHHYLSHMENGLKAIENSLPISNTMIRIIDNLIMIIWDLKRTCFINPMDIDRLKASIKISLNNIRKALKEEKII